MKPHLFERELPFEVHKEPSVAEEIVQAVLVLEMVMQFRVAEPDEGFQGLQLTMHAHAIGAEIWLHPLHEVRKTPECKRLVLHDVKNRGGQISHTLQPTIMLGTP